MLGASIGIVFFDVFRFRRRIIMSNLQRAFPDWTRSEKNRVGRKAMITQGHLVVEFFNLPFMNRNWVEKNIVFEGLEHYEAAISKGKGVLLLGMHMGSGECAIGSICVKGIPLVLIGKRFRNAFMDRLLFGSRARTGMSFIPPHGKTTAIQIMRCLREQKAVLFVLDQHIYPPYGVASTFFGHHVGTAMGLALFAQKTAAPIIPLHTYRDTQGFNHVVFGPEVPFEEAESKKATLKTMTQTFNHVLEDTIRKHPGQWMWIHKRWKPFPREEESDANAEA